MISTDFSLTYPEPVSAPENIQNLYETCRQMLQSNTLPAKESLPLNSSGSIFVVQMLESPSSQPDPAKYILCYSSVPNPSSFLSSAWKLLCGITIFFLLAASILIWIITKGITRPLDLLCRKAKEIGDGNYTPITDDFRAEELENLKRSINCMAENLKKSEESTVAFFQNASHDLKTPLAAISGYAEGIQCGIWEDPKKPAGIILNESLRMSRLVESILTISKLDNKTLDLQIVLIELDEFLYEQILVLQGSCKEKALTAAEPFPSICVMADGALLTRIVQNLVSNCLRYASHEVVIRLIQRGNTAEIIIEDDGPGIPEEKLSQVFQRFYTGEQGGFGLGLSIVKSGIEYMNGTVSVENKGAPQHGVICRLRMPVSEKFLS